MRTDGESERLREAIEAYRHSIARVERGDFNQSVLPDLRRVLAACEQALAELELQERRPDPVKH